MSVYFTLLEGKQETRRGRIHLHRVIVSGSIATVIIGTRFSKALSPRILERRPANDILLCYNAKGFSIVYNSKSRRSINS